MLIVWVRDLSETWGIISLSLGLSRVLLAPSWRLQHQCYLRRWIIVSVRNALVAFLWSVKVRWLLVIDLRLWHLLLVTLRREFVLRHEVSACLSMHVLLGIGWRVTWSPLCPQEWPRLLLMVLSQHDNLVIIRILGQSGMSWRIVQNESLTEVNIPLVILDFIIL